MTSAKKDGPVGIRPLLVGSAAVVVALVLLGAGVFALGVLEGERSDNEQAAGSSEDLPAFVHRSPETLAGYGLAVEQPELLAGLPCYCGCVALAVDPHRSLLDCFVNADGSYDAHASGCAICLDITSDAAVWSGEGRSLGEVRTLVERKYGEVGPSTDNPSGG